MGTRTKDELKLLQNLPLEIKVAKTKLRIQEWVNYYGKEGVYVSFSGGKDSTVLLHIVREMYPDIEAVFVNTGLEYPEIQRFVKTFDNVTILRPKMRFDEVIKKYGYPIISKAVADAVANTRHIIANNGNMNSVRVRQLLGTYEHNGHKTKFDKSKYKPLIDVDFEISDKCCSVMKKAPVKQWVHKNDKVPMIATMADESVQREAEWLKTGCNGFDLKRPSSKPMSFWTEQDVLRYIKENNIEIASVYGEVLYATEPEQIRFCDTGEQLTTSGCKRTGCIFCAFGCHLEKEPNRFQMLKKTHPRQYEYCIGGGEMVAGKWQPNKQGLGLGKVLDYIGVKYD